MKGTLESLFVWQFQDSKYASNNKCACSLSEMRKKTFGTWNAQCPDATGI